MDSYDQRALHDELRRVRQSLATAEQSAGNWRSCAETYKRQLDETRLDERASLATELAALTAYAETIMETSGDDGVLYRRVRARARQIATLLCETPASAPAPKPSEPSP